MKHLYIAGQYVALAQLVSEAIADSEAGNEVTIECRPGDEEHAVRSTLFAWCERYDDESLYEGTGWAIKVEPKP